MFLQCCLLWFAAQNKKCTLIQMFVSRMLHEWKIGFLTADEKEISSRSPPVVVRSDGTMLLRPPVVVLSSWRMKSSSVLRDIYVNKVLCPVFDKRVNMQTSHSLVRENVDSDFKQVISQNRWGLTAMALALNSCQLGSGTRTLFCNCHLSYEKKKSKWSESFFEDTLSL